MKKNIVLLLIGIMVIISVIGVNGSFAADTVNKIKQINEKGDYGSLPRPYKNLTNVPLKTSFYTKLYIDEGSGEDSIDVNSIKVKLIPEDGDEFYILNGNQNFAPGYFGDITIEDNSTYGKVAVIYIYTDIELMPLTKYIVKVEAKTINGYGISEKDSQWSFTTEDKTNAYEIDGNIDFDSKPDVSWQGRFFNGFVRTRGDYNPDALKYLDLIFSDEVKQEYPNAWNLLRYNVSSHDYFHRAMIEGHAANFVREKETRRVISVTDVQNGVELHVEHFFGHEQYGIKTGTPLSADYRVGDEIMIGDATNNRTATVLSINDKENKIIVSSFEQPEGGWDIDYWKTPPTESDPYAPGLFPRGGTYLYKFNPVGTPVYFWDRLDFVLDIYAERYGQRMSINITDAYGVLSVDGKNAIHPKDYVQFHQVTYDLVTHLIERYGEKTTSWVWSIFNEPDLPNLYWRSKDWIELQRFYDYSVDAILKAFEDKGYDSDEIIVGGLELGAIFGTNIKVHDFLAHCSPTAFRDSNEFLEYNAAYADKRLDGKRSRRTEELCAANNGKGTPLDFISVHGYNSSEVGAAKMIKAKEAALEIDPEYYEKLWINNFESAPGWQGFEDPNFADWTIGNGYFPTWVSDFFSRMLNKALEDPRYAYGETILTIWGFPQTMFKPLNDVTMKISYRDGRNTYSEILPKPIFHFMNLLSTMNTDYWVIPEKMVGGHNVSGFAAQGNNDYRLLLYSHNIYDTQSKSDAKFNFNVNLEGLDWENIKVTEYRFDKENNSYYSFAKEKASKVALTVNEYNTLKELTTLKVSNEEIYRVDKNGSLTLKLPVAANGANFVILSNADEDESPTDEPTVEPTAEPTAEPTDEPSDKPKESTKPSDTVSPSDTQSPVDTETLTEPIESGGSPVTYDEGVLTFVVFIIITGIIIIRQKLLIRYK